VSLAICVFVREGIVMASDSRLSLNQTQEEEGDIVQKRLILGISQTDSLYKTFLTKSRVGISSVGDASIGAFPISGYIESFINRKLSENDGPEDVAKKLLEYFKNDVKPVPKTIFIVAGYGCSSDNEIQQVWEVNISKDSTTIVNGSGTSGAHWAGEVDVLARLINDSFRESNKQYIKYPQHPILWDFFTLQDAIDYSKYAIRTTIDTMRFHARPKTVGGSIDILVIKPNEAIWIQRKDLKA
jgi:hypothetical protein